MKKIKTVLITGGSKGIGLSIVKMFLEDKQTNYRVIVVARKSSIYDENIKILKDKYDNEIINLYADLGDENSLNNFIRTIINYNFNIDILINNAGYTNPKGFMDIQIPDFKYTLDVNLIAPFVIIQALFTEGKHIDCIVNIASTSGIGARPGWLTYAASKSALISLSDTLREELQVFGTRVICISPGRCATDLRKTLAPYEDPNSIMQPESVAQTIKYLISQKGKYLISQNLIVRQ